MGGDAFCRHGGRAVELRNEGDSSCPVCLSPLTDSVVSKEARNESAASGNYDPHLGRASMIFGMKGLTECRAGVRD